MPLTNPATVRFGIWLRKKRNFYLFSVLTFGLTSWMLLIPLFPDLSGDPVWVGFLGVLGLGAGLTWGFFMWRLFASIFPSMRKTESDDNAT